MDPATIMMGAGMASNIAQPFVNYWLQNKLADKKYAHDINMWNRANEYNTPAAQMKRFKDAGLNPNLIYSKGQPGLTGTKLPEYQNPGISQGVRMPDVTGTIQAYQNVRLGSEQIENQRLQNAKLAKEIEAIDQMTYNPYLVKYGTDRYKMYQYRAKSMKELYDVGEKVYDYDLKSLKVDPRAPYALKVDASTQKAIEDAKKASIDVTMRNIEKELLDYGITKTDDATLRILARQAKDNKVPTSIVVQAYVNTMSKRINLGVGKLLK